MEFHEKISNVNGGDIIQSTVEPDVSATMMEEVPALTAAAVVVLTALVLLTIAALFLLGVFLDCRQQRLLERKMGEVKKVKNHRRETSHRNDVVGIVDNMEEAGTSTAPVEMLRHIP